ncbi:MAG: hypothetical protein RLZZ238_2407 [Planctomycetota bacterium]|jgi:hypothetical protein
MNRTPLEAFFGVLIPLAIIGLVLLGPPAMAYGIALLARGRHDATSPVCAQCRSARQRASIARGEACAVCGLSTGEIAPARIGVALRAWLCVLTPVVVGIATMLAIAVLEG